MYLKLYQHFAFKHLYYSMTGMALMYCVLHTFAFCAIETGTLLKMAARMRTPAWQQKAMKKKTDAERRLEGCCWRRVPYNDMNVAHPHFDARTITARQRHINRNLLFFIIFLWRGMRAAQPSAYQITYITRTRVMTIYDNHHDGVINRLYGG